MDVNQKSQKPEEELLTCAEAAKELKTSAQTVRAWIALGKIDPKGCFQIGVRGRWRIYRSALNNARIFSQGGVRSECLNTFHTKSF